MRFPHQLQYQCRTPTPLHLLQLLQLLHPLLMLLMLYSHLLMAATPAAKRQPPRT